MRRLFVLLLLPSALPAGAVAAWAEVIERVVAKVNGQIITLSDFQSRQIAARFATADLGSAPAVLEVGGWNIESDVRCLRLGVSKSKVKAGEAVTVTAEVADTLLGGSRVGLSVDGQPAGARWAWARGGRTDVLTFPVTLIQRGTHRIAVGGRTVIVEAD